MLLLITLFFVINLVEVMLGHQPSLAAHRLNLAFLPVFWLALSLIPLIVLQVYRAPWIVLIARAAMAIAALVGAIGVFAHMVANGVTFESPARAFSPAVWGGPESPNWPIAIIIASVIGLLGMIGVHNGAAGPAWDAPGVLAGFAFVFILAGIALSVLPGMLALASACLVAAALLVLASLLACLAASALERKVP